MSEISNDANDNGVFDLGEVVIPNAAVIINGDTFYTDSTGYYHVAVADGSNNISLVIPIGWVQTLPDTPSTYTVTTSGGITICGADFGVYLPAPMPSCYSFDNYIVPAADEQQAFNIYGNGHPGFLQDWSVPSGTPSIEASGSITGVDAYDGTQYALMGVCNTDTGQSEGLELKYNFIAGQTYHVTMAVRNVPITSTEPNPIDIQFILLQDTISYAYNPHTGCSQTPGIPSGSFSAYTLTHFAQNSWSLLSFDITGFSGNYNYIWFRAKLSDGSPLITSAFCFDSLCINPVATTPPSSNCYSFDDITVPPANEQQAFNIYGNGHPGFLQNWSVPSGTPSIEASGSIPGINAYDGNQYALMGVCEETNNLSEGLELAYDFVGGQSYRVTMAIRNVPIVDSIPTPIDVDFILLQGIIPYTYNAHTGCSETPAVPAGSVTVHSITNYAQNSWSLISFDITGFTGNFSQLYFRAKFSSGTPGPSTAFCFDSLCINPVTLSNDCYSFDDIVVPDSNQQQAFNIYGNGNPGFLEDWSVPSGTPSIQSSGSIPGIDAYSGNQYALMGVCGTDDNSSEGLELRHSFVEGQTYHVSMAIRNVPIVSAEPTPLDIDFILLQDKIAYTYNPHTGCSETPPLPSTAVVVNTLSNFAQNSWSIYSFDISGFTGNYTQLWIRAQFSSGAPLLTSAFCMDSFCIRGASLPVGDLLTGVSAISPANNAPLLFQNTQNPFTGETIIKYYLPDNSASQAQLLVHDVTGRLVKTFELKPAAGNGMQTFYSNGLNAGIYLYSLVVNNRKIDTKRMLLIK